jgi:Family of unknown function (DUF6510)
MDDADLRLDGNAAAGLLQEVFAAEMTTAMCTCASCGADNVLGATHLYLQAPGAVLRCPSCTAVVMCVVRFPDGGLVVDLSGLRRIQMTYVTDRGEG